MPEDVIVAEVEPKVEVAVVPEPVVEAPTLDVSEAELEASAVAMAQMTASIYQAQEAALTQAYQKAGSEEAKTELATQINSLRQERDSTLRQLPQAIKGYQQALVEKSKETGVPVRILATAKDPQDMSLKVIEWKLAHPDKPKAEPAPAKVEEPKAEVKSEVAAPNPPPEKAKTDSGISTASTGGEDWRKLPPHERMLYGL